MKVNGEAIYGTTASPFEKLAWGRCTQKKLADGTASSTRRLAFETSHVVATRLPLRL